MKYLLSFLKRPKLNKFIKYVLFIAVLYYLLYDMDYDLFVRTMLTYNPLGLVLMLSFVLVPEVVFAYRWIYASNENYSMIIALKAHTLAGIAGLVAPMKLGELAPIWYLNKIHNVKTYSTLES